MKAAFLTMIFLGFNTFLLIGMNDAISQIDMEVERINTLIQNDSTGLRYFVMINPDSLVEVDKDSERFRISSYKYRIYFIDDTTIVYSHATYEGPDDATSHVHYFENEILRYYRYSSTYSNYICAEGLSEKRQFYYSREYGVLKKSFSLTNGYGEPMDSVTCQISSPHLVHYKNATMLLNLF